jgi:hypothetical protein
MGLLDADSTTNGHELQFGINHLGLDDPGLSTPTTTRGTPQARPVELEHVVAARGLLAAPRRHLERGDLLDDRAFDTVWMRLAIESIAIVNESRVRTSVG